ncbi:MFS transporter [Paenibacillus sp. SC116]|uniref:MFS transporter n=1 Tax=Paenibacillus sp. SC116 TaxID=2968986 RepID=UPI00215A5509|nr:MFS transporter [Paenibacillus sp. SC116]MCR8845144.1 MFS transporter [Paenibacillus sp. SC116]
MKSIRKLGLSSDIALLAVILLLVEFVRGATVLSFIPIFGEKELGITLGIIGTAITAHYLTDTVLKIFIGYLLDRFSSKLIVICGLLISLGGIGLYHWGNNPWIFILASAVYGVGMSPVWLVCLTKVNTEQRAAQMGFLYTIWLVGMGSGPVVLNIVLDYTPHLAYALLLGLTAIALALSFFLPRGRNSEVSASPVPFKEQFAVLRERLSAMKPLLPGMILQTLGASMLVPILPKFAEQSLSLSSGQYSLLLLIGGGCTVVGLVPMGKWSDRVGRKPFLIVGFAIFGLTLASLSMQPGVIMAYALAVILGISYAAVLPAWNALLALYVPPAQKGLGWSLLSTVENIGVLIGPIVGGLIADAFSVSTVIWFSAGLFSIIAIVYWLFPARWFAEK